MRTKAKIRQVLSNSRARLKRASSWIDKLMTNYQFSLLVLGVCTYFILKDCDSAFWTWAKALTDKKYQKLITTWAPAFGRFVCGAFAATTIVEVTGIAAASVAAKTLTPLDFLILGVAHLAIRRYTGQKVSAACLLLLGCLAIAVHQGIIPSSWVSSSPMPNIVCTAT